MVAIVKRLGSSIISIVRIRPHRMREPVHLLHRMALARWKWWQPPLYKSVYLGTTATLMIETSLLECANASCDIKRNPGMCVGVVRCF